ncbi:hypothetical protein QEN19_001375 [Hanseniaspora menglaensis]
MSSSSAAVKAVKTSINVASAVSSQTVSAASIASLKNAYMTNINLFTNYNFREYFKRKYNKEFESLNENFNKNQDIRAEYEKLNQELRMIKRQSIINQLYKFDELIVESK